MLFLFREVLERPIDDLQDTPRARRPVRLPVILSPDEVRCLPGRLTGQVWLAASLMYGSGLRLDESLGLRIKDLDFARRVITVRDGKGRKDRETVMPRGLTEPLRRQGEAVRRQHARRLAEGGGSCSATRTSVPP